MLLTPRQQGVRNMRRIAGASFLALVFIALALFWDVISSDLAWPLLVVTACGVFAALGRAAAIARDPYYPFPDPGPEPSRRPPSIDNDYNEADARDMDGGA